MINHHAELVALAILWGTRWAAKRRQCERDAAQRAAPLEWVTTPGEG